MAFRFRKSIKIAPGVRFNIGKRSASVSIGGRRGPRLTTGTAGTRVSASIPGTGIGFTQKIGGGRRSATSAAKSSSISSLAHVPNAPIGNLTPESWDKLLRNASTARSIKVEFVDGSTTGGPASEIFARLMREHEAEIARANAERVREDLAAIASSLTKLAAAVLTTLMMLAAKAWGVISSGFGFLSAISLLILQNVDGVLKHGAGEDAFMYRFFQLAAVTLFVAILAGVIYSVMGGV